MSVSYSVSQWRLTFPSFIWDNFYSRLTRDSTAYKVEEDHITFCKANQQPIRSSQFSYLTVKLQSKRMNFRKAARVKQRWIWKTIFKSQNEAGIWKRQTNCDELSFPMIVYFLCDDIRRRVIYQHGCQIQYCYTDSYIKDDQTLNNLKNLCLELPLLWNMILWKLNTHLEMHENEFGWFCC